VLQQSRNRMARIAGAIRQNTPSGLSAITSAGLVLAGTTVTLQPRSASLRRILRFTPSHRQPHEIRFLSISAYPDFKSTRAGSSCKAVRNSPPAPDPCHSTRQKPRAAASAATSSVRWRYSRFVHFFTQNARQLARVDIGDGHNLLALR